jgi:hypothetical protein
MEGMRWLRGARLYGVHAYAGILICSDEDGAVSSKLPDVATRLPLVYSAVQVHGRENDTLQVVLRSLREATESCMW